jgi:hypothetical protein
VPLAEVPGEVESAGGPGAGADQLVEREARGGAVVGDLDIVVALPDRPALDLDEEAGGLG